MQLSVNNWNIYPYLVGNPHDPVLRMQQQGSEDNSVVISLEMGDSQNYKLKVQLIMIQIFYLIIV